MTVIDADGGQVAEMTALSPDGRDDARRSARARRAGHRARGAPPGRVPRDELYAPGSTAEATALRLFGEWSPPGAAQSFLAERPVTVVVAPGGRIVDGAPPPSDLVVEVRRAARGLRESSSAPLAEPRLDFRVDAATAGATRCGPASTSR